MNYKEFCRNVCGYETISTFFDDFSIAEIFGMKAIKDTYKRAFNEWKGDYKMITELAMVLNHKAWFLCETNEPMARLYQEYYEELDRWAGDNLKDGELEYYYQTLD